MRACRLTHLGLALCLGVAAALGAALPAALGAALGAAFGGAGVLSAAAGAGSAFLRAAARCGAEGFARFGIDPFPGPVAAVLAASGVTDGADVADVAEVIIDMEVSLCKTI